MRAADFETVFRPDRHVREFAVPVDDRTSKRGMRFERFFICRIKRSLLGRKKNGSGIRRWAMSVRAGSPGHLITRNQLRIFHYEYGHCDVLSFIIRFERLANSSRVQPRYFRTVMHAVQIVKVFCRFTAQFLPHILIKTPCHIETGVKSDNPEGKYGK